MICCVILSLWVITAILTLFTFMWATKRGTRELEIAFREGSMRPWEPAYDGMMEENDMVAKGSDGNSLMGEARRQAQARRKHHKG